jgi:hypothetical protein
MMTEVLTGTVHIAGFEITVAERLRQRCAWCGEILIDIELGRVAFQLDDPDKTVPVFPSGKQVLHDGVMWLVLEDLPGELPGTVVTDPRSCTRVPPELTVRTLGKTDE